MAKRVYSPWYFLVHWISFYLPLRFCWWEWDQLLMQVGCQGGEWRWLAPTWERCPLQDQEQYFGTEPYPPTQPAHFWMGQLGKVSGRLVSWISSWNLSLYNLDNAIFPEAPEMLHKDYKMHVGMVFCDFLFGQKVIKFLHHRIKFSSEPLRFKKSKCQYFPFYMS